MKNKIGFNEIINTIQQADTREQIEHSCNEFCHYTGFNNYLMFGSIFTSFISPPYRMLDNFGKTVRNKKRQIEKITQACINSTTPIITGNFPKTSSLDNTLIQPLKSPSKKGLTISFPVHFPMGRFAFLHISANTNKADSEEKILSTLAPGNLFAKEAGTAILQFIEAELENKPPYLNNREKECLLLATDGSTPQQTGEKMGLSYHTVIFHLKKAREKLASKNIPGAVSKAILRGEIKTLVDSEHN